MSDSKGSGKPIYYIYYWSKAGYWYKSTSTFNKDMVECLRDSYRRCGWATAVERGIWTSTVNAAYAKS